LAWPQIGRLAAGILVESAKLWAECCFFQTLSPGKMPERQIPYCRMYLNIGDAGENLIRSVSRKDVLLKRCIYCVCDAFLKKCELWGIILAF
jgi:hypothetical protein